jgi:hypothetical protein
MIINSTRNKALLEHWQPGFLHNVWGSFFTNLSQDKRSKKSSFLNTSADPKKGPENAVFRGLF